MIAIRSLWLATGADLVLELEGRQTLVIEDLTNVPPVEVEVSVRKVDERDNSDEKQQPRVLSLTSWLKRIVTDFITVWQIMDVVLFLPSVSTTVRRERVSMVP